MTFDDCWRPTTSNEMIIRWWRAVAGSDAVLEQYADHLKRTTFKEMAELPGHLGAAHFEKGDFDDAVVKPSTQKMLQIYDLEVEYYQTLVMTGGLGS